MILGPVNIAVQGEAVELLDRYIQNIRNRLEGIGKKDDDLVFTTYTGGPMSSSLVGEYVDMII